MNLDEALAIILYMQTQPVENRNVCTAYGQAWGVICQYAEDVIRRVDGRFPPRRFDFPPNSLCG